MSTAEIPSPAGAEAFLLHSVLCSYGNCPHNPLTPLIKADLPWAEKKKNNTKNPVTTKEKNSGNQYIADINSDSELLLF